jgi:hypothetical protein
MRLKEQDYPVDDRGKPDLRFYRDSIEYYLALYEQHLGALAGKSGPGFETELAFQRRVHATWGLISKGRFAVPHALAMLKRPEPEAREDGGAILASLGRQEDVVGELVRALEQETFAEPKDSIVLALGQMRNKAAVPVLARIIRDESEDGDTRRTAVEALGRVIRRRFMKQADPLKAAMSWLDKHAGERNEGA